jgi:surface antigen
VLGSFALVLSGCNTVGGSAADLGLAGAGGIAGYQISDGKIGGAAAGASVGYVASRVAQSEIQRNMSDAEKRGYDRALNQAVKQQYWLIQAQQRERVEPADAHLVPVVIPESKINGVLVRAHIEYLRVEQ